MNRKKLLLIILLVCCLCFTVITIILKSKINSSSSPITPITQNTPYHLTATRQRGSILFQLETWYKDSLHQRTDSKVTLSTGEKITIGTIVNGKEYWSYRIEPKMPSMTRAIHITQSNIKTPSRYLFPYGKISDSIAQYKDQGCFVSEKQEHLVVAQRATRTVTIQPQGNCTGEQFDIPNSALVYNNINFYQSPAGSSAKKISPETMTLWIDTQSMLVLKAERATSGNKPWDIYTVLALTYNPTFSKDMFLYTPPKGMTVLTNPPTGIE